MPEGVGGAAGLSGVFGNDLAFGVPGDFIAASVGNDKGLFGAGPGNLDCTFLGDNISPFVVGSFF